MISTRRSYGSITVKGKEAKKLFEAKPGEKFKLVAEGTIEELSLEPDYDQPSPQIGEDRRKTPSARLSIKTIKDIEVEEKEDLEKEATTITPRRRQNYGYYQRD